MKIFKKINFSLFFVFIFFSCRTVPYTGRKQLILFPLETERELGRESFLEISKTEKFSENQEYNELVKKVGMKIISEGGIGIKENWEFRVIENDKVINAFALPGGKVCVYTGLLKLIESEDELACVLGHEIAHVVARHGGERMSQLLLAELGGITLDMALKKKRSQTIEMAKVAYGVGVQVGVLLPFSREQEEESDYMGLIFMTKAGFDPEKALNFWEKMEKESKGKIPEFLSTHPSHNTRIKNIKKWIPEIKKKYGNK
ncbi:MAG: M48 family metallopeptidase [candidate division WOR-3 bacterium]